MSDGFRDLARLLQSHPQGVVRVGVIGLDPQGLLEVGDGFLDLARCAKAIPRLSCASAKSGLIRSACS